MTRMGKFSMDGTSGGPLALLKRLRGGSGDNARKQGGSAGAQQMKMLRRIPKFLRFIPGTAQDVRAYFLTLQYWLGGSEENVANMVRFLVDRYADRSAQRVARHAGHRTAGRVSRKSASIIRACDAHRGVGRQHCPPAGTRGTVGLLLMRSYLLAQQHRSLRRRDRGAGGARPERDAGVRHRARCAAGDREIFC